MSPMLDQTDVQTLLENPTEDVRASIASRLGKQLLREGLNAREMDIAHAILRTMVRDAAVRVRKAVSKSINHVPDIPRDIALTLAADIEEVAIPIIEASHVLSESDLIELVRGGSEAKQIAVASRPDVTETVASALVETDNVNVVKTLVENNDAKINDATFDVILDRHGDNDAIQAPIIARAQLPINISERLLTLVSGQLKDQLVSRHGLEESVAATLSADARERATVDLLAKEWRSDAEIQRLVAQLYANGRLTSSVVLRAAFVGDVRFVEAALSRMSRVSIDKAGVLVHDGGELGLKAIFDRSGLPSALYPALRTAINVYHEMDFDGRAADRERFERRMLERVLTQYEDIDAADIDFLLSHLNELAEAC